MKSKEGGLTSVEGPTNLFKQVEELFSHKKTLFWEMQTELKVSLDCFTKFYPRTYNISSNLRNFFYMKINKCFNNKNVTNR